MVGSTAGTPRRSWPTLGAGVGAVGVGLVLLAVPGAEAGVAWVSYDGPPSPEVIGRLVVWNLVRAVGALLSLVGLMVLGCSLGKLAARRTGGTPARLGGRVLVLAVLLVVGGLVAFFVLGMVDRGGATVSISKFVGPPGPMAGPAVWTRDQLAAALVSASGLVLGAVGTGLRSTKAS